MFTAIEQKISSHDYGVNCSYRFVAGEKGYFRILGGVSYQELKGEQTRLIPGISPNMNPTKFPFPGPVRVASLDAEDQSVGWRLGAAYEIPEYAMRATLVYQSEVKYDLEGTIDNLVLNPITGRGMPLNVESDVAAPQSVEFKFQTGIAPDWLAFGSVKWTDWSSITSVDFVSSDNKIAPKGTKITSLNLYYQDGWTVSGGVGHKFNDQWSAAATVTWDRGTSTGLTSQTDVWLFGLGTNYKPTDQFEVRLAGAAGWLSAGDLDDTMIAGLIWNGIAYCSSRARSEDVSQRPPPLLHFLVKLVHQRSYGQERAIAICFIKADAQILAHPVNGKAEIIFALVHGAGAVFHLPRPGRALGDNRDKLLDIEARFLAEMMPSARPCTRPAMQIWFTIFASWPEPTGPIRPTERA